MQKSLSMGQVVMAIKDLFEKEIGLKNLTHLELNDIFLEFGIKSMRFIVKLDTMEVNRITIGLEPTMYFDAACEILQNRLRETMLKVMEAKK